MELKEILLKDKELFKDIGYISSDYVFSYIYMYSQLYKIYEKITSNMGISHVELSDNGHRGIHAYMINEMSKNMNVEFINKEDDMGLAGLRRFKENYNPCNLTVKYSAYPDL